MEKITDARMLNILIQKELIIKVGITETAEVFSSKLNLSHYTGQVRKETILIEFLFRMAS
jgi:hypothetical protein